MRRTRTEAVAKCRNMFLISSIYIANVNGFKFYLDDFSISWIFFELQGWKVKSYGDFRELRKILPAGRISIILLLSSSFCPENVIFSEFWVPSVQRLGKCWISVGGACLENGRNNRPNEWEIENMSISYHRLSKNWFIPMKLLMGWIV